MPCIREITVSPEVQAAVWHITESTEELLALVQPDQEDIKTYESFKNDQRKKQWLGSRALLAQMVAPLPVKIQYNVHGKPNLSNISTRISITHTSDYAAAAISESINVGIDIEHIKQRIERVKDRFLSVSEQSSLSPTPSLEELYYYWCSKEALYKLHGLPGVDFRNDIRIHPFDYLCTTNERGRGTLFLQGAVEDYSIYHTCLGELMVVVVW
jgi:phosphopantetheinyl transferase